MSVLGLNSGKHVLVLSFSGFGPKPDLSGKPRFVSFCSPGYKRNHFFPRLKSGGSAAGPI